MPTYTPQQRQAITAFAEMTGCKESAATKHLKAFKWDINASIDAYFRGHAPSQGNITPALNKLFDKYRDGNDEPDMIGVEGTMKYLQDLGVSIEEPATLAVLARLEAPTMGVLSRNEFIAGWVEVNADSIEKQSTHAAKFRQALKTDADLFRTVYKHAFVLARQPGQKSVLIEMAVEFWRMLYSADGLQWETKEFSWIEVYLSFVQEKWNKSINKDLWDQMLFFARKTLGDPTLAWWNEAESAWPSILDEFAKHVKELPEWKSNCLQDAMEL